ncbi:hypothetical protein MARPO_0058s0051 [Marchantia polymorpha]|uniref:H(+)-transporting two-sector ATPase n=1 Tax=Marchantia polymorpha TaxID=3197 RepID=A0A2R6WTS0_MARPO|nr:hypothetical protein MARPO_0058s0051 [Marchantia polymorpha]|eukprot:PTQ37263.1 hypothetical protein MARPO_0058s0051 [Marchantia polymorpha]
MYLTQFVWLCVIYMTFYVLLYNDGLPKISRFIKLRNDWYRRKKTGAEQSNDRVEHNVVSKKCNIEEKYTKCLLSIH